MVVKEDQSKRAECIDREPGRIGHQSGDCDNAVPQTLKMQIQMAPTMKKLLSQILVYDEDPR